MKTVTTIKAWILICSIVVTSSATIEHASSHHDVSQHGDSTPQKKYQNTIVPFGIQIPGQVLSTQDVACISADSNIFEIMNKAQETCNGTDMRCTFYHFVNHGYQNIGTLDVDKNLFDDLLMKFDNWLLTAENIEKNNVQLDVKTKEDSSLDTESNSNTSEAERLHKRQGVHIDKVTNESDDDKIVNTHHIKIFDETHDRTHHHKLKNGNHITQIPEYNNGHRYFEVFLPKDKQTGKPRTIYVEVDKDKNEFVLLDEEIDKKLNGVKPIRIELDELSEIADTAFSIIAKPLNLTQNIYNSNDDDRIIIGNINTHSAINEGTTNLDIDVEEPTPNTLNSSICNSNICNINVNQQLIPDNMTGNVKKIVNVSKNLVVPNIYINQAQFYVESQIDNTTDEIANNHLGFLESTNETDIYQTGFYKETSLDTTEFNENNTSIDLDLDNVEYSLENFDIPCENDYDNSTENYELSTEDENVTFDDDYFIELEENNDTSIDIDFDDTHDFSSSNKLHPNEPILQAEKPEQENKQKSFPHIYTEPKLASSLTAGISELDEISSENRQGPIDLQDHSSAPSTLLSPYTTVPIFDKDLVKVLETDGHLQSSFPAYATLDLPAGVAQNTPLNSDIAHPSISSFNSPLKSDFGHQTTGHKISTIFPTPPVECVVRLNKGSKYSPLNFGFSWLPSHSRIEELRLPSAVNSSPQEFIMSSSIDNTTPVEEPRLFQTVPSVSVDIQEPSLTTEPYHVDAETIMPPKPVLPSKLCVPNYNTDFDRIHTTYPLSETPLSVMPYKTKDVVHSPCPIQQVPLHLQSTKPNQLDLGLNKYLPFDNNSKETMIPCPPCKNRYPYTTIPYFLNPYLKPQYLEPLMPVAPLQPASEVPTLDSLPISLDQSYPYINGNYPRETKPISLLPNTAFPPLNPLLLGPGFVSNTLPCQNLWNNIPYLPSTILSDQNIRNYPPIVNNYLTPSAGLQQNQILKPLLSKTVPNQPCPVKNILEITSPSYAPFSPVYTSPIQMDLSPSLALEHDLQSLSLKYGIPLSKILNSLEKEISDVHSKTCLPTFEVPYSNIVHDSSLISKPIFSKTNTVLDDENRSGYEDSLLETDLSDLVPLDSSLIGPHLEIESSLMLESNDSQSYTVLSDTISENIPTTVIHDSSLIGPHLSSLSTSNFVLSDESRDANEMVISESDISNLIPLDSSLIGPHLEIGSPPIVLDSIDSQGDINKSHTEVPVTISSQIEPKLNIQNQPTNVLLDSSLIGSHLPSLAPVKPLPSDDLQTINDMIPLVTDLTDLTPLDSSIIDTQEDFVNKLQQLEILQHEKAAVTLTAATVSPELHKPSEYLPTNLVEEELLLESDSSRMVPLDSSLIGPELKLGSPPIIIDSLGDKTIPLVSKENFQNIDNKVEEQESIILSSSLLPTLLNKPVKADSNLNIITQETKLNEKLDELSLDSNVKLPLTDISLIPFKEKDFKIVEQILELPSLTDDDRNIPLPTEDSRTLEYKSKLSDMTHVIDSETVLDSSLVGASILHKLAQPEISTSLDSSIHFDSSLIGPSILQKIDSREISPILDSVNHLQSSLAATTTNQTKKPSEILTSIDFSVPLESSLKGPTVHHEMNSQEISTAFDSVTQLDNSLVPSLHETKESSATSQVFGSKSQLDSSLKGPSLHQETLEVSRAFASKDLLDSSLLGPNLSTIPFSSDEIKMINEELQPESGLENFIPLDSSLVSPHIDFESDLEQSEISRYQNPETSLLTVINPGVSETTELPCDLAEGMSPLEPITLPFTDQQELLSKFTNAITKSQLLPSELKPCDKLLSSIAKISSDVSYMIPSCKELQTSTLNTIVNTPLSLQDELASKLSPITMTSPAHELSPVGPLVPCFESNNIPTPKTSTELPTYAQGVPQMPFTPYSPFVQMKPLVDRNRQLPQTLNNQNILQTLPSYRPVVENPPVPFFSNALIPLTSEDIQPLLDLASHSNLYPQLSISNMYTPGGAIAPSSEWTTPSCILPLDKYIPLLPKKNSPVLPLSLESTISNSEYNPMVVDDNIKSLLDENSFQLLKDMSILPFSQSSLAPNISMFEKGEIVSPSLLDTIPIINTDYIKTRPQLPISITKPLVPSSIYNPQVCVYNPQNIPHMIQTPNISPCNLQPYSNIPLHSQFSEIIGPAPKLVTIPTESPKAFSQQLLSKPCLESPIILPSSSLDSMLQLPTASNELNSVPCQLPPEYFTPISSVCTTTLSNAFTNPILPIYASQLSVPFAKPISTTSSSLPLNEPYADGPMIPLPLPINPNTAKPLTSKFSSPLMPLKITTVSDFSYPPTVAQNRPMPTENSYKPSQIYSSPYEPIHASPIRIDTSPSSANIMSKLPPAMTSLVTPVFYEPLSTPYFSPLPKLLTNLGLPVYSGLLTPISLNTLAPAPTGLLSPSHLSFDIPTYSYSSLPAPINSQTCPSNLLPAYITPILPVSSSFSLYNTPLSLNPKITTSELKSRLLNTLPIQSYFSHVSKSSPLSNLQIKQNIPLIEETPSYDIIDESACTYSNDKDDKFYQEPTLKYPLESLSYTIAPEEITEALPSADFIKQEDVTPPVNNCASEPSLQRKLYQHLRLKPYAPLHGTRKPILKPHPAPQILAPPSFTESITENISDNIRLVHSSSPLKHPVSLPTSVISSPLLKPLKPLSSVPNFPISSPVLHSPCIDTSLSPHNKLPMNEKIQSLLSSPYYSAPSQDRSSPPIDPRELRNIVTPQAPPAFPQIATNEACIVVSKSEPPILPYILDNYIQLPLTNHKPKSKTLTSQGSLVKPSPILNYSQYAAPIISHIPTLEMPITPQYITPLTPAETLKKPLISPKYISSILPAQTTLQDSLPLNEPLIHYQPYISPPTAFTSAAKNTFMSPPVALPYLPSDNMVELVNTDLNKPQSSLTPQYSVPVSTLPVSKSSPIVSHSNVPYCRISQHIPKQALTNHIIPSSLFMSTDTDFQTPKNKISPLHSIPRKSYPSLSLIEPLETVSFYTPSGPLGTTTNPQNILKTKSPLPSVQYTLPLSSAPYLIQPLQSTDSYQAQPLPNEQYTTKPHPKVSPVLAQYTTPSSSPIYTSLSLETVPKQPVNKPSIPQYNLPIALVYNSPIYSSPLARNPLINPDFKPVSAISPCPVPKNIISLPKLIPSESILLSNLRPLDISQDSQNLHSPPMTFSAPLTSSSLLKPLTNKLPQKSRHYQPHIMPSNSHYFSQLPIDSVPQILPSTSPLLKSPLLKPSFTTSQNNVPLLPMHFSDTNTAFPEVFPIETVSSVTGPDIALSNYFPSDSSNHKYSGLYDSLVAEIPEIVAPINPSLTTTNMPLYSNYDIQEPPPKLQIKANIINTANPVEVSAISASESSPLSLNSLDKETIEDIEPYELMPDSEDRFSQLPPNQNQQRQFYPILYPKYLPKPQLFHARLPVSNRTPQISPLKVPSFNAPSLLSDATELVDTTDFIPISQIKSEPLMSNFAIHSSQPSVSSTDRKVPIPNTLSNIPELDILQLLPYSTFLNTDFPPPTYKQLPPKSLTSQFNKEIPQPSLTYLSPQEYKDLTQGSSASQKSSSSAINLSSTNIDPQLTTNSLTVGPHPQVSLYTSPMATTPDDWLQSRNFKNSLPVHEKLIEVTPEKESIPTILNKSKPANTPQGNSYPYEPKSTISQVFSELDTVKTVNPLLKSKEHYTEYIEDLKSNVYNDYDPESDNVSSNDNKPDVSEAKPTESLPEIIKGFSVSNYNNKAKSPQRLSKLDHFYVNNHIGKSPQIFNVPNYNISPIDSLTDVASPYTIMTPEILKDITNVPTRHFGSVPKLDTNFLRPNEFYPEIADSPENIPTTNSYPQNYLNPCLKYSSKIESPLETRTIELADTSEMIPTSYSPYNNIDDIKYSGYKTYQIPSFKSPQTAHNLGTPTQKYSPSVLTYSSPNPSKVQQKPRSSLFYRPTEISNPLIPQYQTPIKITTPLQTKLGLDTLQKTPELNEYYPIEDKTKKFDGINEDDELKTSLINYINKREDVKNHLFNNNAELTIPLSNLVLSKKGPYNANTIETNNPSIGLKVWKSKVKIIEPELKLKFKDLSVNNFMPIVNNLDKYDMEEIRKLVKNYIDEKYGDHIEVNEPYAIDNKYTVIKDFDHNAVDSKFNLLWPTNYV